MLKKLLLLIAAPILLMICSCGNNKKTEIETPGMSVIDFSSLGIPITMNVPDTTKTKLETVAQGSGTIEIKSGKDFQINITPGEGDFQLKKSDVSSDEVKKLKRFVIDEPSLLVWEAQISGMESEFHFYTAIKVGKDSYVIEDIKDTDTFGEASIQKMVDAAKSIKGKEAAAQ
ncbi:MAG: hypothetical protein IT235_09420 [Bacteroidia bacterium]|nr:hypothetical protein [Bacteroidia bacterium]